MLPQQGSRQKKKQFLMISGRVDFNRFQSDIFYFFLSLELYWGPPAPYRLTPEYARAKLQ